MRVTRCNPSNDSATSSVRSVRMNARSTSALVACTVCTTAGGRACSACSYTVSRCSSLSTYSFNEPRLELTNPTGLLISWATPAASWPMEAMRSDCISCAWAASSSRTSLARRSFSPCKSAFRVSSWAVRSRTRNSSLSRDSRSAWASSVRCVTSCTLNTRPTICSPMYCGRDTSSNTRPSRWCSVSSVWLWSASS